MMVGCVKQGTNNFRALLSFLGFLIHKIQNKSHKNYSTSTYTERRAVPRIPLLSVLHVTVQRWGPRPRIRSVNQRRLLAMVRALNPSTRRWISDALRCDDLSKSPPSSNL